MTATRPSTTDANISSRLARYLHFDTVNRDYLAWQVEEEVLEYTRQRFADRVNNSFDIKSVDHLARAEEIDDGPNAVDLGGDRILVADAAWQRQGASPPAPGGVEC